MKLYIQAMAAKVTREELEKNLNPETMKKLTGKTITPYVIGEEGKSNPRVIGEGSKTLTWPRAVIRRMAETVKKGTKLFINHNSDSSTNNREPVGEVVGSFSRMVKGKIQALVLTVLSSGTDGLDICSIEADAEFDRSGNVGDIGKITGIALGSSRENSPAFPGAQRVAALQCFEEDPEDEKIKDSKDKPLEKGEKPMAKLTFAELKQEIKDMNVFPHQLYDEAEMKADNVFGKLYTQNELLTKENLDAKTKVEELENTGKESLRKSEIASAAAEFEKLIPEGSTDKQKEYFKKHFDAEKIDDLSEAGLKKTVETLQTAYSEEAKFFGVEENTEASGGTNDGESNGDKDPIDEALDNIMEEE